VSPEQQTRLDAIDQQMHDINEQIQVAQTAGALKIDIDTGDLQGSIQNAAMAALNAALDSDNFDLAQSIADQTGDTELQSLVRDTIAAAQGEASEGMSKLWSTIYTPTGGATGPAQGPAAASLAKGGPQTNPFASVNTFVDELTANIQTKAPQIDSQLQLVSDGTTEISTTAQTALPAAQLLFAATADRSF
jgi:hypothetical protein